MYTVQPTRGEVLQHIRQLITLPHTSKNFISVPNLLVPSDWLYRINHDGLKLRVEDAVLYWFLHMGFQGARTRHNISPYHGYQELFENLTAPPPWVHIEIDDCLEEISPERAKEIVPLYLQVHLHEENLLEEKYKRYLTSLPSVADVKAANQFAIESFKELLFLAKLLGVDLVEELAYCVLNEEEPLPASGTPDLFLWWPNEAPFWFFAEVKGKHDYLRHSQYEWITRNWDILAGRILIISVF
jgi:hypothetical protein